MVEDRESLLRQGWRLDALDKWRERVDSRLDLIERQMAELVKADEIAEAVAEKVTESQALHLSASQRRWAFLFGAIASVGSLGGFGAFLWAVSQ